MGLKKQTGIFLFTFILSYLSLSCSSDDINEQHIIDTAIDLSLADGNDWEFSGNIWDYINAHRTTMDKPLLIKDTTYASAYAMKHTNYMISTNSVNHNYFFERSNGLKSYGATTVSETVAYAYNSAESVVNAWLQSDTHKEIIEGNYTHVGFGVQQSPTDQKFYFTLLSYR